MADEPTIAGLPAEEFVGRRVRLKNRHAGHMLPATLVAITSRSKAEVQPDSHKSTEQVEIERIHPWWSQNPDLKEKYDALEDQPDVEPDEPEEEPEDDGAEISLPELHIEAGANPEEWLAKLEEFREVLREEATLESMLRPVREKKNNIIAQMKNLGVTIKK